MALLIPLHKSYLPLRYSVINIFQLTCVVLSDLTIRPHLCHDAVNLLVNLFVVGGLGVNAFFHCSTCPGEFFAAEEFMIFLTVRGKAGIPKVSWEIFPNSLHSPQKYPLFDHNSFHRLHYGS